MIQKTALITGASRGLGLALARALAQKDWKLIIDARGVEALEDVHDELVEHTKVIAIPGDVSEKMHRKRLAYAAKELGGLDALVNNAGILGPSPQPNLIDYPLDILADVYRINVIAPLGLVQALQEHFKPQPRIINISSDAAAEAYPGWGGYGSSKAALEHLSAVLVAEQPDWRIFWVDPGDMRTRMQQEAFPNEDISDRPEPETSVPGLLALLENPPASGRYVAKQVIEATLK